MKKLFSKMMLVAMTVAAFVACEDVPEPYDIPGTGDNIPGTSTEIEGGTGEGTLESPFNPIAALNYGNKLASGEESPTYMYVKGKVVDIAEQYTTQYGNARFTISEDGSAGNTFLAYRVLYLGNKKFTANDTEIKIGDDVIVCGIITNYNGTIETAQNKGFLYSLNGENRGGEPQQGVTSKPEGEGTLASPYNAAAALQLAQQVGEQESDDVYIKGKVVNITEQYGTQFGNATFTISDDGTNASTTFTVYRALYLGNKKYTSGDVLKEGDDVIVYGKVTNFRGNTPETVQGKAYLYSLNGNTGDSETPQPQGEAKGSGTETDPFNVAAAIAKCKEVGENTSTEKYYIKGIVVKGGTASGGYGNVTFDMGDTQNSTETFKAFQVAGIGGEKLEDGYKVDAGDEVVVYGPIMNYKGNTPETAGKSAAYIVSIKKGGQTPDPQPSGDIKVVTVAEFNAAEVSDAVWYQLTGTVKNLKDDDQYGNFDLEDETGSVYVYGLLSEKGGAKKQFQELAAAKGIKNGSKLTLIGNRGDYQGKIEVTNAYFVSIEGGSDTPDPDPQPSGNGFGTLSGNVLTLVAADLGVDNGTEPGTVKLVDGATLTFDGGGNSNTPKYYTSGASIRMYPKNSMTVKANGKTIQSIILTCSSQSGTLCNASGDVTATPGSVSISGDDVNVSSINSSSTSITNSSTTTGAPSQLRFSKMVITYAE